MKLGRTKICSYEQRKNESVEFRYSALSDVLHNRRNSRMMSSLCVFQKL